MLSKISKRLIIGIVAIFLAATLYLSPAIAQSNNVVISPSIPDDIPGGAPHATQEAAATFAWRQFIALNWPAMASDRSQPDPNKRFGAEDGSPLTWETFYNKVEIYPGIASEYVPTPTNRPAYTYGRYETNPGSSDTNSYAYVLGPTLCDNSYSGNSAPYVNLDEANEIGLNKMYAGIVNEPASNQNPGGQFLFLAKANQTELDYVTANGWTAGVPDEIANNTKSYIADNHEYPPADSSDRVGFPNGTIEVKSAWRQLNADETGKFHTAPVRYYRLSDRTTVGGPGPNGTEASKEINQYCPQDAQSGEWGMAALHIIMKTPSAPYFIFATFDNAYNIVDENGNPVEDLDGNLIRNQDKPPFEPAILEDTPVSFSPPDDTIYEQNSTSYNDLQKFNPQYPQGTRPPGQRLYYINFDSDFASDSKLPQLNKPISVNRRVNSIPDAITNINREFHQKMRDYGVPEGSSWFNYRLVNVQWSPLVYDEKDPDRDYDGAYRSSYYLSNDVVETDYNLQLFSGQQSSGTALITDYASPAQINALHLGDQQFRNVFHDGGEFNLGGCIGCHGVAANNGRDFSFIIFGGQVIKPEGFGDAENANAERFAKLLQYLPE